MAVLNFLKGIIELFVLNAQTLSDGLLMTLKLTGISLAFAFFIGIIFGILSVSKSKILTSITKVYVYIIRGVPLLVLSFFIYFGLGAVFKGGIPKMTAGIITLTLNASAYMSEIVRGGILAVNRGQMEAARSLGLSYTRAMRMIIIPQAVRVCTPSLINQLIITLKDTTILSTIGIAELVQTGKIIIAANMKSTEMWLIIAIMYFIPITVLSLLSEKLEKSLRKGQK